ncbi:IS1182 family transposase [Ahrensia sp. R2A130]|uniref:IS1182 family transposase n=1 Tax=Ahrensia sp. R2A130 TaxID=744979 RepID=UPI0001E0E83D|nr:IS1182 family transposase [Ahrensia sp. R2A130]EFL90921.1 transposase domain protein [Ahrensia sp. R2A130]
MKRFIEVMARDQAVLFPDHLEDFVGEDNPVRAVDAFVEALDLAELGFAGAADTGRPGYHPSVLLKIYIYGYLNRIHSSRRLECEAGRNVEVMWLTGRLAPDFKTIADFRRDNGSAIRKVCRQFVGLCRQIGLLSGGEVAIDGSKFKAVNNRDRNFTPAKMQRRMADIEASIDRYMSKLDAADRDEPALPPAKVDRLQERIVTLKAQMVELKAIERDMQKAPDKQISLTDPDARSMNYRGSGIVGYNIQTVVDTEHHLIVAHEVTTSGSDRSQLVEMSNVAREATGHDELRVIADRGYYSGEQLLECAQSGITTLVPKPLTSSGTKRGMFAKQDFTFDAENDLYICPAGETLTRGSHRSDRQGSINFYRNLMACATCRLKDRCTPLKQRRIRRWDHEDILDEVERRLDENPDAMRVRRSTVEHPFGTLKAWMGHTHFLTRTRPKVAAEMSLHILAYNLRRVLNIVGLGALMVALQSA